MISTNDLQDWEDEHQEDVLADGPYLIPTQHQQELIQNCKDKILEKYSTTTWIAGDYYDWIEEVIQPLETVSSLWRNDDLKDIMLQCFCDIVNKYNLEA